MEVDKEQCLHSGEFCYFVLSLCACMKTLGKKYIQLFQFNRADLVYNRSLLLFTGSLIVNVICTTYVFHDKSECLLGKRLMLRITTGM